MPGAAADDGDADARRTAFLHWQCLLRQQAMRRDGGRPSPGMAPELLPAAGDGPAPRLLLLLNRLPAHAAAPEFRHLYRRTRDPRERREAALERLAATHYQRPERFSDRLTAILPPHATSADTALAAGACRLRFHQDGRGFLLPCRAALTAPGTPLFAESIWFGRLFNPALPPGCRVLSFAPDWSSATAA